MGYIPVGFLITVLIWSVHTWWALAPLGGGWTLRNLMLYTGAVVNELPHLLFVALGWSMVRTVAQGDIRSPGGWLVFGLAVLTQVGLLIVIWRGARAIPVLRRALDDGLGTGWREVAGGRLDVPERPRFHPVALLGPFFRRLRNVGRVANLAYGDAGFRNLLDVYHHRSMPANAPVLIHLHAGAFMSGQKNRQALPLLYRLASKGWVCISANYRLKPEADFPDWLIDAKKVLAWVRAHGEAYGADTSAIFVAGGSAGGTIATQMALTPNAPEFQPGFEDVDTSFAGAIPLYGYFGWVHGDFIEQAEPPGDAIPPVFVIHGDKDTLCPVEDTRYLVRELRRLSENGVVYAELPGAQHNFDLFHSIRAEAVIDAIEIFAACVRGR